MSQPTRVALISGGMGSIGQAIARTLATDGFHVVVLYHSHTPVEAEAFVQTLPGEGHAAFACSLVHAEEIKDAVDQIMQQFAMIDICIHAAVSPLVRKRAAAIAPADFRQQFEVTLFGGLNLFQAVIPCFKKQKSGLIIGITTDALEPNRPVSGMAGYVCAKQALRGLLRELAKELVADGINVCAVAPGFVPTALHKDLPERLIELLQDKHPLKKLTTPEDVADAVASICSNKAMGLNGLSLPVGPGEAVPL